mmetsp:Transcript_62915/g.116966  ORF Transcript_62915/g.116966 Transcript_62915/m.116966 type:complete len:336 (-) Transcript_62915:279-1286(-)
MAGDESCAKSDAVRSNFASCAKGETGVDEATSNEQDPQERLDLTEMMRRDILLEVDSLLERRSSSLLQEGAKEISKIQDEREQVGKEMDQLQARQDALKAEQAAMHGALADITSKLDFITGELFKALSTAQGAAPGSQTPEHQQAMFSAAGLPLMQMEASACPVPPFTFGGLQSGGAEESLFERVDSAASMPPPGLGPLDGSSTEADFSSLACASMAAAAEPTVLEQLFMAGASLPKQETWGDAPRTPPRATMAGGVMTTPEGPQPGQSASPAVRLSLESALSSSARAPAKLNIADCLDMDTPPPILGFNTAPGAMGQASGQLRAEAPAFVPGVL